MNMKVILEENTVNLHEEECYEAQCQNVQTLYCTLDANTQALEQRQLQLATIYSIPAVDWIAKHFHDL